MDFKVSVIIPVYNAERFLRQAVESAVTLAEVGEVVLVEDGSPDNSIALCNALSRQYDKVKLFRHPHGQNRGAADSRNLGIENATCNFIAFLDADDWYLPNRFKKDHEVFSKYPYAQGAYSCTILEDDQQDHSRRYGAKKDIRSEIGYEATPQTCYRAILKSRGALFNTDSVTLKKDFLVQDKLFDKRLKLHQDTELWQRLLRRGYFFAGEISQPVAVVRRHELNRITSRSLDSLLKMWAVFIDNVGLSNLYSFEKDFLVKSIVRLRSRKKPGAWQRRFSFFKGILVHAVQKDSFLASFTEQTLSTRSLTQPMNAS